MTLRRTLTATGIAAAFVGGGLATAPSANAMSMSDTFPSISACNKVRLQYVRSGGYDYVSSCAKRAYGLIYFLYE